MRTILAFLILCSLSLGGWCWSLTRDIASLETRTYMAIVHLREEQAKLTERHIRDREEVWRQLGWADHHFKLLRNDIREVNQK